MLFNIFTTSSPAKLAAATTTRAGSQSQRASPPPAPITKTSRIRGVFQRLHRFFVHEKGVPTHPSNMPGFATSSAISFPIVPAVDSARVTPPLSVAATYKSPLPTALLASDLATARRKIAELESALYHLERQKADKIKGIHNMFYNAIVPTATAYANELDAQAAARKFVEEQLEQEIARHTKADELMLKEREQKWDAEEAKQRARNEMEMVREATRKLEGQLLDLQAKTDHLHAEAFQEALKRLDLGDASDQLPNHSTLGNCIVPFIERLNAEARRGSWSSWSSSWYPFERIPVGSELESVESVQDEETYSRPSPASASLSDEGLTWANIGSVSPSPRPLADPPRQMLRGRQRMPFASGFEDSSNESDFGAILGHRTYRVSCHDNDDDSGMTESD